MDFPLAILIGLAAAGIGLGAGLFLKRKQPFSSARLEQAQREAATLLAEATARQKELLLESQSEALKLRTTVEAELRERRADIQRLEQRVLQREETFDRKLEQIEQRDSALQARHKELDERADEIGRLRQAQVAELERIARLSQDQARDLLLRRVEEETRELSARRAREIELQAREEAEAKARQILTVAIQRYAAEQVSESTISVVPIPSDEMKGRIIGREGRNIRALEAATGVDLIIDDTPEAVTLSGFDPVRREIARVALTKLVTDGRINPVRVEELVAKAKQEVEQAMRQEGEQAAYEAGVRGLHAEIIKVMGRMKFRTSYGQNQLQHSVEAAHLAAMIAAEVGADINVARRGAFLHDIGKVLTHEVEGPHHIIGADFIGRFGEPPKVCDAVGGHHDADPEHQSLEAVIVQAADAASGARPGARRENVEQYVQRLTAIENVANSFAGVEKSFAIQAGREVRVLVKPEQIDDEGATRLAREIVKEIESTLQYPGQIKVTVVRETRAVEFAR